MLKCKFAPKAQQQYNEWVKKNPIIARKINKLVDDIVEHPTKGIGKPEALKYELSGLWSRRITLEHRLVYTFDETSIYVLSCEFHYK